MSIYELVSVGKYRKGWRDGGTEGGEERGREGKRSLEDPMPRPFPLQINIDNPTLMYEGTHARTHAYKHAC